MQNVEFHNLYGWSVTGVSKNSGKMGKDCGMHGSEGNLEQIFDWKTGMKESIQKTCECGRITLKWILRNCHDGF
jgi:hypothetical protein